MSKQVETQKNPGKTLTVWEGFEAELASREQAIYSMLPSHVNKERFKNSVISAVKQTPDLLKASPRSFFAAVTKSAQDGLIPDGREGVITAYKGEAKWNPMAFGLRKRAREIDSLLVDAQVVHENDEFLWVQGDNPCIEHTPAPLGTPRGEMIGAYAIFKNQDGILHREVMDPTEIAKAKAQSKQPEGLLWGKFTGEAWRKTVLRRGFKTVPCSEKLTAIITRDDENYEFDEPAVEAKPRPQRIDYQSKPPAQGEELDAEFRQATTGYCGDEPEEGTVEGEPEDESLDDITDVQKEADAKRTATEVALAPKEDSAGLPLKEYGRVVLYSSDGEQVSAYERSSNYFAALKEQSVKDSDPQAMLELNRRGAQIFIDKNGALQMDWDDCWSAALEAQAARDAAQVEKQ